MNRRVAAYLGVLLGMAMGSLDSTIVTTALPTIAGELNGANLSGWVMTSYLLATAITTPIWGKASDALGRRRLFLAAVAVFLVGSVLCGLSTSMEMLIAVRVIQGVGAGGLMSLGLAATGDLFSPRERGRYSGYSAAVFGGATVIGPVLGGILTDTLGWQSIFYINVPLGAISLVLTVLYFRVPVKRSKFQLDVIGVFLITVSLLALLLLFELGGGSFDWLSLESLAFVLIFLLGLAAFIWWERRAPAPLVPLQLFRHKVYRLAVTIAGSNSWAQMTAVYLLPIYLQLVQGVPAAQAGLTVVPLTASLVLSSLVSGQIVTRTGRYRPLMLFGATGATVGFAMFALLGVQDALWWIILASVIAGLGLGAINNVTTISAQNAVPVSDLGVATSTVTLCRSLGQTAATAIAGAVASIVFTQLAMSRFDSADVAELQAVRASGSPNALDALAQSDPSLFDRLVALIDDASAAAFAVGLAAAVVALVCALRIPELHLRQTSGAQTTPAE